MTDEPPRKKVRYAIHEGPDLATEPVLVRVGCDGHKFYVHESLLCLNSDFFRKALKDDWQEGERREVKLSHVDIDIFKLWMQWLYTSKLFLTKEDDQYIVAAKRRTRENTRWEACYALGDFLKDHEFKDACIDACIEAAYDAKGTPSILPRVVYTHSPKGSAHRQFALDVFVHCRDRMRKIPPDVPAEFLEDVLHLILPELATGMTTTIVEEYLKTMGTCKYHDHGQERPCYRTKAGFRL